MDRLVKMGDTGKDVQALQILLLYTPTDGLFTEAFKEVVKGYQTSKKLMADGVVGPRTKETLVNSLPLVSTSRNVRSLYTRAIQTFIGIAPTGVFDADTKTAVAAYQASVNLKADGIVGQNTWSAFFGLDVGETDSQTTAVKPPDFKQYDKRWAKVMYSNHGDTSQTMKSSACGPTSMCDIVAEWWNKDALPTDLAQMSLNWGTRTRNSGTSGTFFRKCADFYKASKYICTSNIETAINCLKGGGYVVVCFGKSKWTSGGHYCCMWKYDGKYFYINDPASSSSSRSKGTYNEVKSARKGFYCFWR